MDDGDNKTKKAPSGSKSLSLSEVAALSTPEKIEYKDDQKRKKEMMEAKVKSMFQPQKRIKKSSSSDGDRSLSSFIGRTIKIAAPAMTQKDINSHNQQILNI